MNPVPPRPITPSIVLGYHDQILYYTIELTKQWKMLENAIRDWNDSEGVYKHWEVNLAAEIARCRTSISGLLVVIACMEAQIACGSVMDAERDDFRVNVSRLIGTTIDPLFAKQGPRDRIPIRVVEGHDPDEFWVSVEYLWRG